jgi:hypothetical protein
MTKSGWVVDEKLIKIISISGNTLSVAYKVIVFPDPGGPQSKKGLCSDNHAPNTF